MTPQIKLLLGLAGLGIPAAIAIACGSSSNDAPVTPGPLDTTLGTSCDKPVPLAGALALSPLPPTANGLVPLSGNLKDDVPVGAVGLVANAAGVQSLAFNLDGKPMPIPESEGVVRVTGAIFPGSDYRILVFSRAALTPRALFAGKTIFMADPEKWSLEIRLLDARGKVVSSHSMLRPGRSIEPLDIEVTDGPDQVAVLVKLDRRMTMGHPPLADGAESPITMEIFDLKLEGGSLRVTENAPEAATKEHFQSLAMAATPPPICPPNSCGVVLDAAGNELDCGECMDSVCVNHACVLPSEVPNGVCTPKAKADLCAPSTCGKRYDGCSSTIDCGSCGPGLVCGLGKAGECGDPASLIGPEAKTLFGETTCGCFVSHDGKTGTVACPTGQTCKNGACAP